MLAHLSVIPEFKKKTQNLEWLKKIQKSKKQTLIISNSPLKLRFSHDWIVN